MHPRVIRVVAVPFLSASIVAGGLVLGERPASADPPGGCLTCSEVGLTPDGLLARARSQMEELNSIQSNPPPCNDETPGATFPEDGNDTVEYEGYIRWRLTINEQGVWDDDPTTTGYRRECYIPGHPNLDGLIEVRIFDAITPEILAQVAIDDALSNIPALEITTNPTAAGMVAIPTWFWIDGADAADVPPAVAEVPGITVIATAAPGAVRLELGDGTMIECPGGGTPYAPGATSDCTHDYQRAGNYTITATVLWTGTYTVNGDGPFPIETAVPRTNSQPLAVNEAQAINTRSGG